MFQVIRVCPALFLAACASSAVRDEAPEPRLDAGALGAEAELTRPAEPISLDAAARAVAGGPRAYEAPFSWLGSAPAVDATVLPTVSFQEIAAQPNDGWSFLAMAYLWAVGVEGTAVAGGEEIDVDVDFDELLDDLEIGGSLFFEARNGRWGILVDGTYMALEGEDEPSPGVDAETETDIALVEVDAAYRLADGPDLDLIAGLRYVDADVDVNVPGMGSGSGGIESTLGIIGARARWELGRRWMLNLRGDVGFGSDSAWQLLGLAKYEFGEHWGLVFGYRAMELDIEDGSTEFDAVVQGFMLGLVFAW